MYKDLEAMIQRSLGLQIIEIEENSGPGMTETAVATEAEAVERRLVAKTGERRLAGAEWRRCRRGPGLARRRRGRARGARARGRVWSEGRARAWAWVWAAGQARGGTAGVRAGGLGRARLSGPNWGERWTEPFFVGSFLASEFDRRGGCRFDQRGVGLLEERRVCTGYDRSIAHDGWNNRGRDGGDERRVRDGYDRPLTYDGWNDRGWGDNIRNTGREFGRGGEERFE